MQCSSSQSFVLGKERKNNPHYFVDLTEDILNVFDILNSMCILENYNDLLLYLESNLMSIDHKKLVVPPFDVFMILLTVCTITPNYKNNIIQENDHYNTTLTLLNRRVQNILKMYIKIVKDFNTSKYEVYDLELLRCQLFLMVDSLIPSKHTISTNNNKRKNKNNSLEENKLFFPNKYESYVYCLDKNIETLGNTLLHLVFHKYGEFTNCILWTLVNSMSNTNENFLTTIEIWIPLLNIIFDILELRHEYFIMNELRKELPKSIFDELSESPLAKLFKMFVVSHNFSTRFCEYIFIECEGLKTSNSLNYRPHPIYHGENTFNNTYVQRVNYSKRYKLEKSFIFRRRIISLCYKLVSDLPRSKKLLSDPRMNKSTLTDHIVDSLLKLQDIVEFKTFFKSDDLLQDIGYLPYLAQKTFFVIRDQVLYPETHNQYPTFNRDTEECNFVENFGEDDKFLEELLDLVEESEDLFTNFNGQPFEKAFLLIEKSKICLVTLIKYFLYLECNDTSDLNHILIDSLLNTCKSYDEKLLNNIAELDCNISPFSLFSTLNNLFHK
ncbi:hypothetical protein TBLA_0D01430 [Henningerozyma blattae CBS 6284]|uniref:Uncharacterized protein n=1 Tax=Henningerozyma blattae (strain ATCC 34711 / CBS 6284 / DSM 70876 / NBRC 10599 / NRRL Y-10934 / UCD 77-7) TaxID=1071380 RepID=I2H2P8_HENB6|nr:hypothetical protein TBLA_0D01430 [Tetrapisispora blattae CBS 6284]CCH60650.1 hypothetical protein TBLA_0D01430 [Tetrapisispora blattae CBS 6284]